jgi:negative regulator of flagellin synthesis FlgM
MRVDQTSNNNVQGTEVTGHKRAEKTNKSKESERTAASHVHNLKSTGDAETTISEKGKEFAQAKQIASDAPDVREDKVAELKRRIASGKYQIDNEAVADRMVDEHVKMHGMS